MLEIYNKSGENLNIAGVTIPARDKITTDMIPMSKLKNAINNGFVVVREVESVNNTANDSYNPSYVYADRNSGMHIEQSTLIVHNPVVQESARMYDVDSTPDTIPFNIINNDQDNAPVIYTSPHPVLPEALMASLRSNTESTNVDNTNNAKSSTSNKKGGRKSKKKIIV